MVEFVSFALDDMQLKTWPGILARQGTGISTCHAGPLP